MSLSIFSRNPNAVILYCAISSDIMDLHSTTRYATEVPEVDDATDFEFKSACRQIHDEDTTKVVSGGVFSISRMVKPTGSRGLVAEPSDIHHLVFWW
jgi:hypothetical protein